jgi:ligand-binding sensor domain-containing protein/signal transduction histidine kinase
MEGEGAHLPVGASWVTLLRAGLLLPCTWACLFAGGPADRAFVTLPVSEGADRLFVPVAYSVGAVRNAHSTAGQIIEDGSGFLWVGTQDGLKRYDGYRFRDFRPDVNDPNSLSGVFINALFKDRSGMLWVASDEHLDRYDPATETFAHFPSSSAGPDGLVHHINQDRDGIIWLATSHGLNRIDPATGKVIRFQHDPHDPFSLSSDTLRSTFEQKDGTFWVASVSDLDVFDRRTGKVVEHYSLRNPLLSRTANASVSLLEDHAGVLWVASTRDGLAVIDRRSHKLVFIAPDPGRSGGTQPSASAIHEDTHGALWVGTNDDGLLRLDPDRKSFVRYRHSAYDLDSLSANQVLALFEDHEDGLWVGTGGGGIMRVAAQPLPFQRYPYEPGNPHSLGTEHVSSVFVDSHGVLWAGGKGAVTRIDRKTGQYSIHKLAAGAGANSEVLAIVEDRSGQLWFGTRGEGLNRFDPRTGRSKSFHHDATNPSSLSHEAVFALFIDRSGTLWAGTEDGLNAFDPARESFRVYKAPGISPNRERAIAQDASGALWLATLYAGVHRFDPVTGEFTIFRSAPAPGSLSSDAVAAILVDRSGAIWAGTESGLDRWDPVTRTFKAYYESDGLPNNNVNGILEDGRGTLWVTTHNGLSNFDPGRNTFRNYYRTDGVLGDFLTAWKSPAGELFFGAVTGLTTLLPDGAHETQYVPPVVVTTFQLSDKTAPIGGNSPLHQSISLTESVTLPHQQNSFSFEFSALSFVGPERTRYRFRLEPLEKDWNEVDSTRRFARYTTVAPGDYVFRVQSRTSRSAWSDSGARVNLVVLPPWWSTWWFRMLCVMAFGVMVWLAYRVRLYQLTERMNLRFEERLSERTRIAQELHDTLLQGFLSVSMQVHVANDCLPEDSPGRRTLTRALQLMGQVIEEGRNAVRGLRSSRTLSLDLEQAFAGIQQEFHAKNSNGGQVGFRVIAEGQQRPLHPLLRDEIYRIGREALTNAFRHARANQIEVELKYASNQLRLVVRDDGCGIDQGILQTGREGHWGLPGMRERADRIGGRLHVFSSVSAGTEVELLVPSRIAFQDERRGLRWFRRNGQAKAARQQPAPRNGTGT